MEIFLDCLPCMLRQALEASRMATDRADVRERIMDDALRIVSRYRDYRCSPDLCRDIHRAVKAHAGVADPYAQIKRQNIEAALDLLPNLLDFVQSKQENLYWALKVAATGNVMDSALYGGVYSADFIRRDLEAPFAVCDLAAFEGKLQSARRIVIIADNSGETVFDRVLIRRLGAPETFYAVRSEPILNDATEAEAHASGLGEITTIVSTGCNAPGAMLEDCSEAFRALLQSADLIISKGQGNYEALWGCGLPIFFLLKAKCPVIAKKLGVGVNEYVLKYQERPKEHP